MNFEKAANFIWENGRLLERRLFEYFFQGGSKNKVLHAIKAYQNEDGGFGHALEPDLRTPESQPLYVEFGLRTLYEAKIQDPELAYKVCRAFVPLPIGCQLKQLNKFVYPVFVRSGDFLCIGPQEWATVLRDTLHRFGT